MTDPATDRPLFVTRCIELACEKCKEEGKSHECVHMLHLVPSWQSAERHRKLKIMMQDRPDLIQSELAGLAFDSLQQVFRKCDVSIMFDMSVIILNYSIVSMVAEAFFTFMSVKSELIESGRWWLGGSWCAAHGGRLMVGGSW